MTRPGAPAHPVTWLPTAITAFATVVALALELAWLPRLPAEIAIHWSGSGVADGSGPSWTVPVMTTAIGLLCVGLTIAMRRGVAAGARLGSAVVVTAAVLVAVLAPTMMGGQLEGGRVDILPPLLLGALGGIALGALVVVLAGRGPVPPSRSTSATPLPLAADERAVWLGHATLGRGAAIALAVVQLAVTALVVWAAAQSGAWALIAIPVVVAVLVIGFLEWRVRIDRSGLIVRPLIGAPAFRVPLDRVAGADTVQVEPLADFGGWGVRVGATATGVITRAGEAISVERIGQRRLVVTVDDAEAAVALLAALRAAPRSA
ncbi:DUF1648 domain-containing protein [Schumannella soli]|uniref:DUF1648 domain-containing protein n=1 Tax=Schumannella soli TaxID=2590779 RepID=A0A506XXM2_9MICO|nr:DUF1648 domain-containing protein [Schumannella soli]TPW74535.1 DUF1648 domain-containing protein [Schumannella soli]